MKTALRIALWVSLAALLVSCATPGDRESIPLGVDVPSAWSAGKSSAGQVQRDWWTRFGDPELNALVMEALEHNKDIQQAAARISAARAMARMAGADLLPHASIGPSAARGRAPFPGGPVTQNSMSVSFGIGWELDLWGRIRAGQLASIKNVEVARAGYAGARLSVIAQTVKARFAVEEARRQAVLVRTTVQNYEDSLRIVEGRFARGISPSIEVRLSNANLASARALLEARLESLDRAVRRLEIILGRYPKRELGGESRLPIMPPSPPAGLPSDLLNRRPDVVAARFRVFAADAKVFEARASLLPRLSLTASGGTVSPELSDLFTGSSYIWQLAGNLLQPVFQGGKLRANVDLQKARAREAVGAYGAVALNAFREVESALAAEKFLRGRVERLEEAALNATEARRQAQKRYAAGVDGLLMVLEAQRRELDAQGRLLTARRERLDNRVNLHLALGGSF
ncbi:MAG: efflux transporter outer membrane subunit [Planctomycetota bacterium]|jgi:NodT family efflux transporter outer membrane factor (OMF) lipoprotein